MDREAGPGEEQGEWEESRDAGEVLTLLPPSRPEDEAEGAVWPAKRLKSTLRARARALLFRAEGGSVLHIIWKGEGGGGRG